MTFERRISAPALGPQAAQLLPLVGVVDGSPGHRCRQPHQRANQYVEAVLSGATFRLSNSPSIITCGRLARIPKRSASPMTTTKASATCEIRKQIGASLGGAFELKRPEFAERHQPARWTPKCRAYDVDLLAGRHITQKTARCGSRVHDRNDLVEN